MKRFVLLIAVLVLAVGCSSAAPPPPAQPATMPNVPAPEPDLPPAPEGQVTDVATGTRQWSPGIALQVVEKPTDKDAPFKPWEGLLTLVVRDANRKVLAVAPVTGNDVSRLVAVDFAPGRPMVLVTGRQNAMSDYSAFAQVFAFEGGKLNPVVTYTGWMGSAWLDEGDGRPLIRVKERLNLFSHYLPADMHTKPYPRPYRTTSYAWENGQFRVVAAETTRKAYPLFGATDLETPLPEFVVTLYRQGLDLIGQGKPAEAVKPLEQAVAYAQDYTDAHNDLSYAYALLGQWDKSGAAAQMAVMVNPWHAAAQYNLGVARLETHDLIQAEYALRVATGLQEDRWEPHYKLGLTYEQLNRLADAKQEFDLALKLKPDLPELQEARRRVGH